MAWVWSTARCPVCGTALAAQVPATPGARWFTCASCRSAVPVLPPTDPPPIFSWEVYPGAYPPLPPMRLPGRAVGRLAAVALVASLVILVGVAGALIASGAEALGPGTYSLSGTVVGSNGGPALFGANVVLQSESGWSQTTSTGLNGTFAFAGIPGGGASLNVSAIGYGPVTLELFFSPTYKATGASENGLIVSLAPGPTSGATIAYQSPFPNLESFVSSVWSAAVLLLLAAVAVGIAATCAALGKRPAVGVVGGVAAAIAPAALGILGVTDAFPLADVPAIALVGLGTTAAVLELLPLIALGRAAELG